MTLRTPSAWVYIGDAVLYPLGLVIAAVAVDRPGLALISLSPTIVLLFFGRERHERLERRPHYSCLRWVRNSYGGGGVELPDERGIASI